MKYFLWILGFVVGFVVPPMAGFAAGLLIPLPPGPVPINLRAAFYVCLGVSLLLSVIGLYCWRRGSFVARARWKLREVNGT